tara:strand:- start:21 stop:191 length:171 start_codon:yes stop_codon:yes gene_type:complete
MVLLLVYYWFNKTLRLGKWEIKMLQKWLKVNANKKPPLKTTAKVRATKNQYHLTFI